MPRSLRSEQPLDKAHLNEEHCASSNIGQAGEVSSAASFGVGVSLPLLDPAQKPMIMRGTKINAVGYLYTCKYDLIKYFY